MRIAFWSNVHGQTATTSNMVAVALMTALEYRLKVLITHNHFEKSTVETSLVDRKYVKYELMDLANSGIDALARFIKSNKLDKENISNYTTTLLKNKLDLLMGTSKTNKELYVNDLNNVIDLILESAKEFYDIVFIDVSSGNNELSSKILQHSEIIVVNLNQNINVLDDFFDNHKDMVDKSVFLIGKYNADSRINKKNIMRRYGIKKNIAVIPYNIEFSDACSEGRAIDLFMRNLAVKKDDLNYMFIEEVRNAVKLILSHAGIDITLKKLGD
ncbi:MAG: hypothetical protein N3B21_00305 [Clostridia bacterium]|nr:hypothetical protein [Clostridia bacterium]